jgi:Holliday junction resolvase
MGKINSRAKGASAEREFCKELGEHLGDHLTEPLKRNLEQTRNGGHDILGLEGMAVEIKRYKALSEADLNRIWSGQVLEQANRIGGVPVLAYREDFQPWRIRLPLIAITGDQWPKETAWTMPWTIEVSMEAFAYCVREHLSCCLHKQEAPNTLAS